MDGDGRQSRQKHRCQDKASEVPLAAPSVVVRVRPLAVDGGHSATGKWAKGVYKKLAKWDDGVIVLEDNVDLGDGKKNTRPQTFTFAKFILGTDAKQEEVYQANAAGLVQSFVQGFNVLLFAYGQTGTGKTHTIFGHETSWESVEHEQAGIFPRAIKQVFEDLSARADTAFIVTASAMEFYMCQCTDLVRAAQPWTHSNAASSLCTHSPKHTQYQAHTHTQARLESL